MSTISRPPKVLAFTCGDPAGVGPEIIMKTLAHADVFDRCRPLVVGDARRLAAAGRIAGVPQLVVRAVRGVEDARFAASSVDCIDLDLVPAELTRATRRVATNAPVPPAGSRD